MQKNSKVKVRPLRQGDFGEVSANYWAAYEEAKHNPWLGIYLFSEKPSVEDEQRWLSETLEMANLGSGFALVAELDGKVVGLADVRAKNTQQEQQHIGVVGVYVVEGCRSMGVGTALLNAVIDAAKKQGKYEMLILSAFGNNQAAMKIYRKIGFTQFGELPNGIKRNGEYTSEVYMYLSLNNKP